MDSTAAPEVVFADEIKKLRSEKLKPYEQITLEPFEQEHAVVVGVFQYATFAHLNQFYHYSF
jgi:rRNA 2'-O-methyltransferase fibrillarin